MRIKRKPLLLSATVLLLLLLTFLLWNPTLMWDERTGYVRLRWSGFSAVFNDEPFGLRSGYYKEAEFDGIDGPYVYYGDDAGYKVYNVTAHGQPVKTTLTGNGKLHVEVPIEKPMQFNVQLRDSVSLTPSGYPMPSRLLIISDIEGNFKGFYDFLIGNKVIDSGFNWIFGDGHLVLLGDFVDRGNFVIQVLWLVYMLEQKAAAAGGQVHYILGNHEIINLEGIPSYAHPKYIRMAQSISGELVWDKAYQVLFNRESVLGHWLSKKNAIERIGPYLFVHAGISPKLATMNLSIGHINETVRTSIYKDLLTKPGSDSIANFLMGREGPLWYRGMVTDYKQYLKMTTRQFDEVLTYTGAGKIVIGHTVVADINTDHGGRLIKTDILHGSLINRGRTKGVFVENKREFVTDDQGKRSALGAW